MNRLNKSASPSDRRSFLKRVSAAGLGLGLTPAILKGTDDRKVSLGFIGIGGRGSKLLRLCLGFSDVSIPAVCDIASDNLRRAQDRVEESGHPRPNGYGKDETSYLALLQRDDLDGVVIATPWELHIPMAIDSMKAGIYAGVEVGPANSIEECWELVETYEETRVPCMFLENNCYARYNMAILRMVREGVFGELIHCQCGYAHDLRERLVLGKGTGPTPKGEGDYRSMHNQYRNGELYPTHSIGPRRPLAEHSAGEPVRLPDFHGDQVTRLEKMVRGQSSGRSPASRHRLEAGGSGHHDHQVCEWGNGGHQVRHSPAAAQFLSVRSSGYEGHLDAGCGQQFEGQVHDLSGRNGATAPMAVLRSISGAVRTSAVEEILDRGNPPRTWWNRLSGAPGLQGMHQAEDRPSHRRLRHGGLDGDLTPLRTIDPALERTGGLPGFHPGQVDEQSAFVRGYVSVLSRKRRRARSRQDEPPEVFVDSATIGISWSRDPRPS